MMFFSKISASLSIACDIKPCIQGPILRQVKDSTIGNNMVYHMRIHTHIISSLHLPLTAVHINSQYSIEANKTNKKN